METANPHKYLYKRRLRSDNYISFVALYTEFTELCTILFEPVAGFEPTTQFPEPSEIVPR